MSEADSSHLLPRVSPLDGFISTASLDLSLAVPCRRYILRGPAEIAPVVQSTLGLALPQTACRAESAGARHALWLGPDEHLLISPIGDPIGESLTQALAGASHSLVDVSHRQVGLNLGVSEASARLSVGCPLDLDLAAFPVGMCTRTLFGKAELVLWRRGDQVFHLEVWRSFSAYVWRLIEAAAVQLET